jgi:hypothetical protein
MPIDHLSTRHIHYQANLSDWVRMTSHTLALVAEGAWFHPPTSANLAEDFVAPPPFRPFCKSPNHDHDTSLINCRRESVMCLTMPFHEVPGLQSIGDGLADVNLSKFGAFDVVKGRTMITVAGLFGLAVRGLAHGQTKQLRGSLEFFPESGMASSDKHVAMRLVVDLTGRDNPLKARKHLKNFLVSLESNDEEEGKKRVSKEREAANGVEAARLLLKCCVVSEHVFLLALQFWKNPNLWRLFGCQGWENMTDLMGALSTVIIEHPLRYRTVWCERERNPPPPDSCFCVCVCQVSDVPHQHGHSASRGRWQPTLPHRTA